MSIKETKISWLVQSNRLQDNLVSIMGEPALQYGLGVRTFEIDTSLALVGLDAVAKEVENQDEILIPYGSTTMIRGFAKSGLRRDGFFYDPASLKTSRWLECIGGRMLNHDAIFLTLEEAAEHIAQAGDGEWFVKPDADLKDFTGSFVNAATIGRFRDKAAAGGFSFSVSIPVVVAPTKNTGWEYRLFMIGGTVIAASSYRLRTLLDQGRKVPAEVIAYAKETASVWTPNDVYVMDVGETDNGLRVVEFNCFHASGLYACDERDIVREVSSFVKGRL